MSLEKEPRLFVKTLCVVIVKIIIQTSKVCCLLLKIIVLYV